MRHQFHLVLIALQFLTRVPVPRGLAYSPAWLNESARYFPLIGTFVGLVGALVIAAASLVLPWAIAVALSMVATVVLTGAFHEDGLADTCDALGGAVDRDRALAIMKDSRLGTYGVVALVAALGLKYIALSQFAMPWAIAALVVAHTASRAVAVTLMRWMPYAGDADASKAKPLATGISNASWAIALMWPVLAAACWPAMWRGWLMAFVGALLVGLWCARWFRRRLGGITGDTLGATQQMVEIVIYLALLLRW